MQNNSFQNAKVILLQRKTITFEMQVKRNSISKTVFLLFYMHFSV